MAGFLLDTNIPSEQIRSRPDPRISTWINAQPESTLFLSAITIGELRKGTDLLPDGKRRRPLEAWFEKSLIPRFFDRILPVTQAVADRWGLLTARRQLAGVPLSITDGLIAATALHHGLTVVTRNVKDFADLGVPLLNPWETT
jgi:predicted nucleic acid-binding protein